MAANPLMPSTAVYLYCVVKAARRPSARRTPAALEGGTPPGPLALARGLWLITSDVPLDIYGPGHLEPRLENLEWVAGVALAHERVVERFSRLTGATVIPMTLFTMFSSAERAIAELSRKRKSIDAVARRVRGCEEWGVRVTRSATGAPRKGATPGRATTGAAFLAGRRDARDAARAALAGAVQAAEDAYGRLSRIARSSRVRAGAPPGGTTPPLLDAAFLVPVRTRTRFRSEAKRQAAACAERGAAMTLTGPWPPYNFVGDRP